jgi:MFS superfamily sulfate permease-like transporter
VFFILLSFHNVWLSLLEAISIAKALAKRSGDTVDANQELLGA